MTDSLNRQFRLRRRPVGRPSRNDFELCTTGIEPPAAGQILVRVHYLSLDPGMRGWMDEGRSYMPPVAIGEVMRAFGIGTVLASRSELFAPGEVAVGLTGVQDFSVADAVNFSRIDPALAPLPRFLGALGLSGMTAYFGLLDIGQPRSGDCLVVSAAAGAVGALVGQIGRIHGCRVVGIAGGQRKCRYLRDELGFDVAIDYRAEDVGQALQAACPAGVDIYFDNVGGEILDQVLARLAPQARVVICGAISQYNRAGRVQGPANYLSLLVRRARMQGFLVFDYAPRYSEASAALAGWLSSGALKADEDVDRGLETFPEALGKLFTGEHLGKLVLEVQQPG
jgi:NADPH-dependent curcumin reductase CurA